MEHGLTHEVRLIRACAEHGRIELTTNGHLREFPLTSAQLYDALGDRMLEIVVGTARCVLVPGQGSICVQFDGEIVVQFTMTREHFRALIRGMGFE